MLKQYIFEKVSIFLNYFFKKKYQPTYTFTMGRRKRHVVRRRPKIVKKQEEDSFEKDKKKLLKHMEEFYDVYGTFVNTYAGSSERVAFAWNDEIWKPMSRIKNFVKTCELFQFPISPSYSSVPPRSSKPIRRARRPYRPFQDLPATSEEDKCNICMTNKKIIGFFPCGHVGICNSCCKNIYKNYFKISNKDNKPYLLDTLPEPPIINIYDEYENEEDFIHNIIHELCQPRFHISKKCVFCKEKIKSFKIIYSI